VSSRREPGTRGWLQPVIGLHLLFGMAFFDRFAPLFLLLMITGDLGAPPRRLGLLAGAIGLGWAAASLVSRFGLERLPMRRRLVIAFLGSGVFSLLSVLSGSWTTFVLLRFVGAAIAGTCVGPISVLTVGAVARGRDGSAIGFVYSATRLFGNFLAPVVVTSIAVMFGWRAALAVSATLMLAVLAIGLAITPPESPERSASRLGSGPAEYVADARRIVALATLGSIAALGWLAVASQNTIPLLEQWLGVDSRLASSVLATFGASAAVSAFVMPRRSDVIGRFRALQQSLMVGGIAALTLGLLSQSVASVPLVLAALLLAVSGISMGAIPLAISLIPVSTVVRGDPTRMIGLPVVGGEIIGSGLLALIAGSLIADFGPGFGIALGGLVLIATAVVIPSRSRAKLSQQRPASPDAIPRPQ
jgi:predicted MFS family arabinose efflux permease